MKQIFLVFLLGTLLMGGCNSSKITKEKIESTTELNVEKKSLAFSFKDIILNEGLEKGMSFFEKNKSSENYELIENEMYDVAYQLLYDSKKGTEAIEVFQLIKKAFSENARINDSLGEAYLAIENYDKSVKHYRRAIEMGQGIKFYQFGFLDPQKYTRTVLSKDTTQLFEKRGNENQEVVFVFVQGGPDSELHIGRKDPLYLMSDKKDILRIYPYQTLMLNSDLIATEPILTKEQSAYENELNAEILHRVISYWKNRGKKIYLIGHSFGASICMEYLNSKKNQTDKVFIMGLDLDEDPRNFENVKSGEYVRWKEGTEPYVKRIYRWIPDDYPAKSGFDRAADNLTMIVKNNMDKKYTELLKDEVYKNMIAVYATMDEANGPKSKKEIDFIESKGGEVIEVVGDHHSMVSKTFMEMIYAYLIEGKPFG